MSRFIATLALTLLASLALAQTHDFLVTEVFDAVYADEVVCADFEITDMITERYETSYCGFVTDALTSANKILASGVYEAFEYQELVPWKRTRSGSIEMHTAGYVSPGFDHASMITLILAGDVDATLVVLSFEEAR